MFSVMKQSIKIHQWNNFFIFPFFSFGTNQLCCSLARDNLSETFNGICSAGQLCFGRVFFKNIQWSCRRGINLIFFRFFAGSCRLTNVQYWWNFSTISTSCIWFFPYSGHLSKVLQVEHFQTAPASGRRWSHNRRRADQQGQCKQTCRHQGETENIWDLNFKVFWLLLQSDVLSLIYVRSDSLDLQIRLPCNL